MEVEGCFRKLLWWSRGRHAKGNRVEVRFIRLYYYINEIHIIIRTNKNDGTADRQWLGKRKESRLDDLLLLSCDGRIFGERRWTMHLSAIPHFNLNYSCP